jgi:di/tricarboxylate transporter
MISSKMMMLAGTSQLRLFLIVMIGTGIIGSVVSNTGTVAVMMPIVVSMAAAAGTSARRLLMPLAFASSMGGMMTLIGTPPNLIVSDTLQKAGFDALSFFSFLPVGLVTLAVGVLGLLPLSKIFLAPKDAGKKKQDSGKSLDDLVGEYGLTQNLFRVHIKEETSEAINKSIADLNIYHNYGINVLELRRSSGQNRFVRTVNQKLASPELILKQGDVLYLSGEPEMIANFANDYHLRLLDIHTDEIEHNSTASIDFFDIGVAELLFMPTSTMINRKISEIGFRGKFNVNVLGIRRGKEYILKDMANQKVQEGDIMLVQGAWSDIARMKKESDNWVVLGEPLKEAQKVTLDHKAPIAALILIAMIVVMAIDKIPVAPVTSVLVAAVLMVVTGCVRSMEAAYKSINWQTIVLFAAMLPMSIALEKTGVSTAIADSMVSVLGGSGPILMLAGIYAATSVMTIFISNTVTAVLMAPIALQCALQIGVSPVPFMFAVTVAASMCFASPFSTPPNALVMSAGQYTFMDYIKVGLPMQILMGIVMVLVLPLLFPF